MAHICKILKLLCLQMKREGEMSMAPDGVLNNCLMVRQLHVEGGMENGMGMNGTGSEMYPSKCFYLLSGVGRSLVRLLKNELDQKHNNIEVANVHPATQMSLGICQV